MQPSAFSQMPCLWYGLQPHTMGTQQVSGTHVRSQQPGNSRSTPAASDVMPLLKPGRGRPCPTDRCLVSRSDPDCSRIAAIHHARSCESTTATLACSSDKPTGSPQTPQCHEKSKVTLRQTDEYTSSHRPPSPTSTRILPAEAQPLSSIAILSNASAPGHEQHVQGQQTSTLDRWNAWKAQKARMQEQARGQQNDLRTKLAVCHELLSAGKVRCA
jgi:hypothetical protein